MEPEQEQFTTKERWLDRQINRLLRLTARFEFVREVLIFTFFVSIGAFWFWRGQASLVPYITAIIIAHIVALTALGITRMVVNPDAAAVRKGGRNNETDDRSET